MPLVLRMILIGIVISGSQCHADEDDKTVIYGTNIEYINIAFNHYLDSVRGSKYMHIRGNIKYHKFYIQDSDDEIFVRVGLNHPLVRDKYNFSFKGGGAEYILSKDPVKIVKYLPYK